MPPRLRLPISILACFLGPAFAGVVVGAGQQLAQALSDKDAAHLGSPIEVLVMFALNAALPIVFGTLPMLAIGLPVQAIMAMRGATAWFWYAPTAAIAGASVAIAILPMGGFYIMGLGALYGGLAGFFAWAIRRPDKDRLYDAAPR